ncbi:MAG: DUF2066 domain-containing protein [Gammaproteobacteria bacterium]
MLSLCQKKLFTLILCLIWLPAWAVDASLFTATVPMAEDTQAARAQGFKAAMDVVLTRVVGRLDAPADPALAELRNKAESYVQQYRIARDGLWVAFDGEAVQTELGQLGFSFWGGERPPVLLVLAVDEGGGRRYILSAEDEIADPAVQALRQQMMALADLRGLPMLLPLMDAQDRSRFSFTDAWGGFEQPLLEAAQRYGVKAVLLGRYSSIAGYRVRWALFENGQVLRWDGPLDDGINGASDRFAARYSVATGAAVEGEIGLSVAGINSLEEYARVNRYLEGITAIESIGLRQLQDDIAVFGLRLRGSLDNVDRAIRLGGVLLPAERGDQMGQGALVSGPGDTRPVVLSYRLR